MRVITVSLPADTHLGLIGGVQEKEFGLWVPVEPARWMYEEDGRILASYTREEARIVVGMMEVRDEHRLIDSSFPLL